MSGFYECNTGRVTIDPMMIENVLPYPIYKRAPRVTVLTGSIISESKKLKLGKKS